jgi:hypothetical protein
VRPNLSGEFGGREGEPFSLGDQCGQRGHRASIPSMKARIVGCQLCTQCNRVPTSCESQAFHRTPAQRIPKKLGWDLNRLCDPAFADNLLWKSDLDTEFQQNL